MVTLILTGMISATPSQVGIYVYLLTHDFINWYLHMMCYLKPSSHHWHNSSWVTSAVCMEFTTSSRWLQTDLVEKLKSEHVELSWVSGSVYYPIRRQSRPSFQFCSQLDWMNSQHVQFSVFRPNPPWTSCTFNTHRQCRPGFPLFYWQKIQDYPGTPQEIFQYFFGAHECLNIKKQEARSVGVGFLGGGSEPPPHQL